MKKPHPAATVWPMMAEAELREMAESIKANGLRDAIVLDPEGRILDGRNRQAACQIASVEPRFETYDGDPVEYVADKNNSRRHMTVPQRAAAMALMLNQAGRRENGRWKRGSVSHNDGSVNTGSWSQRMKEAGLVLDHAPKEFSLERVRDGEVALDAAVKEAKAVQEQKKKRAELPDDLGALVDAGELKPYVTDTKRKRELANKQRNRMIRAISAISACVDSLWLLDVQKLLAACPAGEFQVMTKEAKKARRQLGRLLREWEKLGTSVSE